MNIFSVNLRNYINFSWRQRFELTILTNVFSAVCLDVASFLTVETSDVVLTMVLRTCRAALKHRL